jgi:cytochrome c biogenesis protein CcdA
MFGATWIYVQTPAGDGRGVSSALRNGTRMLGLDNQIATLGSGEVFLAVAAIAILLGLRHATDPDHLTAVTTLIAGDGAHDHRKARSLGFVWGLGHATTLFAFGLPIVIAKNYLPEPLQQGAEAAVGMVIIVLALRLLVRWRQGAFRQGPGHSHSHGRTPLQAYLIGLVHGMGGSAGVGVLLLAAIPDRAEAIGALALFAFFTAVSMALASSTFGYALTREPVLRRFARVAPALGALSLVFGIWYSLGAVNAVPYVF